MSEPTPSPLSSEAKKVKKVRLAILRARRAPLRRLLAPSSSPVLIPPRLASPRLARPHQANAELAPLLPDFSDPKYYEIRSNGIVSRRAPPRAAAAAVAPPPGAPVLSLTGPSHPLRSRPSRTCAPTWAAAPSRPWATTR
jgi:hypothetical protein